MPRHRFTDTKDRIERAAIRLFVAKGVAETTVRDIARAVDISEGALYRHFASKEQLVAELFERHYAQFAARLGAAAEGQATAHGRIAAMIRAFCEAHDENPELFRFLLFVQHEALARLAADAPSPVGVVRAALEQGIDTGELPRQSPDLATAVVFGIVLEPAQFAAYGRLPPAMQPMSARLIAAAWAALTNV